MNSYSYDECLAILDFCAGLERHTRLDPDIECAKLLGGNMIHKILGMNHIERIDLIKQVVQFL